jgi:tetratricopeptide (TPR) repeat protein
MAKVNSAVEDVVRPNAHWERARALQSAWEVDRNLNNLDLCIDHYRKAIEGAAPNQSELSFWYCDLYVVLRKRDATGDIAEARAAIDKSIELSQGKPIQAVFWANKGGFLHMLAHKVDGNYENQLRDANGCYQMATEICERYLPQTTGQSLSLPFEQIYKEAAEVQHDLFESTGTKGYLNNAIISYETAEIVSTRQFPHRFALAELLIDRYRNFFDPNDCARAVGLARDTQKDCQGDLHLQGQCFRLRGRALASWFDVVRKPKILKDAIEFLKAATEQIPRTNKTLALAFNDLGNTYCSLHSFEDSRTNLNKGLKSYSTALEILQERYTQQTETHPDILMIYNGMGTAWLKRYIAFQERPDLSLALDCFKRCYASLDTNDRRFASRVSNYAYSCWLQFRLSEQTDILGEADRELERALTSSTALAPNLVNSLKTQRGIMFLNLYLAPSTHEVSNLNRAIQQFTEATMLDGLSPIVKATTTMNLAIALGKKAILKERQEDFDDALATLKRAKELVPGNDPMHWNINYNAASLYHHIHERHGLQWGESFGRTALELYTELIQNASIPPNTRLRCAEAAATLSYKFQHISEACKYQTQALEILPELIVGSASRREQLRHIRANHQVPSTTASISLAAGESVSTAICRLESGRAFLWDRLLIEATLTEDLAQSHQDLADEFQAARSGLFREVNPLVFPEGFSTARQSRDLLRLERERNWRRYEDVLIRIREQPGFATFMRLSNQPSSLQQDAFETPIVYINASHYRSDALIITFDQIYSVPLPQFSIDRIKTRGAEMLWAKDALSKNQKQEHASSKFEEVMEWLWEVVAWPVLESIDLSRYQRGMTGKPRVIWITTGWMSLFPIHAAGRFRSAAVCDKPSCVHDMVVSTYTTSIKALRYGRDQVAAMKLKKLSLSPPKPQKNMLLVAMQFTDGRGELHKASEEVSAIAEQLGSLVTCSIQRHPDASTIKTHLRNCDLAFFACHSEANTKDPSKSAILLGPRSGPLVPLSVSTILKTRMDDCELVYLSSCESGANNDLLLTDEGLSIAGAFHMVGVIHSVSGMWQIEDELAFKVSTQFFRRLIAEQIDIGRAAEALHLSVQSLREEGVRPMLWGSFIHTGC